MTPEELMIIEWKKASLYRMLARFHQFTNRDLYDRYNELYNASARKLADAVHAYGDPFHDGGTPGPDLKTRPYPYAGPPLYPGFAHAVPLREYGGMSAYPPPTGSFLPLGPSAYPGPHALRLGEEAADAAGMKPGAGSPAPTEHAPDGSFFAPPPSAGPPPDGAGTASSGALRDPSHGGAPSHPAAGDPGDAAAAFSVYPPRQHEPSGTNRQGPGLPSDHHASGLQGAPASQAKGLYAYGPEEGPLPLQAAQKDEPPARIRMLNACPGSPAFDVYAAGSLIAASLPYKSATGYIQVQPGVCTFHLAEARRKIVRLTETAELKGGTSYTAAAAGGSPDDLRLYLFQDEGSVTEGYAKTRFIHLALQTGGTDVMLRDGGTLFRGVTFAEASPYVTLAPLSAVLQITSAGSPRPLLEAEGIELSPGKVTTAIAVGRLDGNPPLEAVFLHDA